MLQFVFFHWPKADVDHKFYVECLKQFHTRLNSELPAPYAGSAVFEMASPPGVPFAGGVFADWYAVSTWGFVDTFKTTAVGAAVVEHAAIAQGMEAGAGAMYASRAGAAALPSLARHSYWFSKPKGMQYAELDALLAPAIAVEGVTMWQRQLVLGPTPEFVITSPISLTLTPPLEVQTRSHVPIYSLSTSS